MNVQLIRRNTNILGRRVISIHSDSKNQYVNVEEKIHTNDDFFCNFMATEHG